MSKDTSIRGKRLFVAVALPDYVKDALAGLMEKRRKGFHWVARERLHLTLRFIGDLPGQLQPEVEEALAAIEVEPFLLPVEGVGSFPERGRAHAVWAGLGNGHPALFQLKKKIEDGLFAIGFEPEKRVYQPHLTLARVNQAAPETIRQFLKEHRDFGAPPFAVEAFHLYRSEIIDDQRVHTMERTFPLQRKSD